MNNLCPTSEVIEDTRHVIFMCELNHLFVIWSRDAETVFSSRKSGSGVEIFKTFGEHFVAYYF